MLYRAATDLQRMGVDSMTFPELETERLKLVRMDERYLEAYFNIMSNDHVMEFYGMEPLKQIEDAEKIITSMKYTYESGNGIRWAIVLKDTGAFAGTLGLNLLRFQMKRTEIGYELGTDFWGKGIASEAVKEVLRYSFQDLGLFRIGAVTFPQNESSIKLLKKLGFIEEGRLRGYLYQNEQSHDAMVFSLLRTDEAASELVCVERSESAGKTKS
ncbi:GNAT family N-acetyltransferase [Jeotgalibacillus haloalkalitolerans]|uniref:GNAT family protein n=1 Tax=Jeotgalibacillus haloalkalitolerans TaxID=3104292 RepID=A0ABU5KPP3_9BACL|nr:GNAT family protein [Jeotgalibacillus sp. HH7-29]MDZ5712680.1 GNAT family protein [Jeotgalibacillus sp. HH7-29]